MRKRIVIAALAVLVVGVVAFVLSQPTKGSVEYHKRKYLEAHETGLLGSLAEDTGWNALDRVVWKIRRDRIEFHRQALIDARFFERKEFIFSNRPRQQVTFQVGSNFYSTFTNEVTLLEFPLIYRINTSGLTIIAQPDIMRQVEEIIRQADVPETPQ